MRHSKKKLLTALVLLLPPIAICVVFLGAVFHGNWSRRPSITVNVADSSGYPIEDVNVIFLDCFCLGWCLSNEVDVEMIHITPTNALSEMVRMRLSTAKTDLDGHAEVRGFFFSTRYFWGETVEGVGELILVRSGFRTQRVGFNDKRFRCQIIKGRVNFDLVMKEE